MKKISFFDVISIAAVCVGAGFGIRALVMRYKAIHTTEYPENEEGPAGELDDVPSNPIDSKTPAVVQVEESSGLGQSFIDDISPFSSSVMKSAQKAASAPIKPGTGFVSPVKVTKTTSAAAAKPVMKAKPAAARRTVQLNVSGSDPENGYLVW
jgi:hypothetical protein